MGVPTKAFLSYSHDSPDHRDQVLTLADRLRDDGIDAILDQYEDFPPEGWPRWMDRQIREADFVLLICTETYLRRVEMREDPGKGHGVLWEANLIYNALNAAGTANRKFVPVLLDAAEPSCIPKPLQGFTHYRADTEEGYQDLLRLLTAQPETPKPPLGPRKALPPRERKSAAPPVLWHVPYPRNPFFTGREDVLQRLRDALAAQGAAALTQSQAISGLGGIGKTQTALEYAYRHRSDYAAVFWLPADSDASLRSAFLAVAATLDLAAKDAADPAEAVAAVQQWLEQNPGWLLIFDNADQPEVVWPFLPRQGAGHILVTSRAHALQSLHIAAPLSLDPLPAHKATEFLLERTGRHEAVPEERRAAEDLAHDLGYLPLALEQAAAYIAEKPATFTNYLSAYRQRGIELLSRSRPVAGDYPGSVATTWALNFEEVEKHPASADVLRLSAFLAPDQIPLELLEPGAPDDPLALDELLAPATHY